VKIILRILLVLGCLFVGAVIFLAIIFRDRRPHIYFAAERGDTNALALYLSSGSNVNASINCYPFSEVYEHAPLLDVAVESGQIVTVDFLLKRGANPNEPDSRGKTPLMWALGRVNNDVGDEMGMRIFKLLLSAGADPNAQDSSKYGYTPLIYAASLGQTEKARVLFDCGAEVNATNKAGQTALHLAVYHPEIIPLLLSAGANPSVRDDYRETPVERAIRLGYTNALVILTNAQVITHH
jgi:uncharacterized protein